MSAATVERTAYTPDELEAAIESAGAEVEREYKQGHRAKARELLEDVKRLVAMRSPDMVAAMEFARGLR